MAMKSVTGKAIEIKLAHSPDSDDAFMFYGLATQKVRTPGLKFAHVLADIETLNQAAPQEIYDVTAFSFAAYPYLRSKYILLDCGASFWRRVRSYRGFASPAQTQGSGEVQDWRCRACATSAYMALGKSLRQPRVEGRPDRGFDQIPGRAVKNSIVDAGAADP